MYLKICASLLQRLLFYTFRTFSYLHIEDIFSHLLINQLLAANMLLVRRQSISIWDSHMYRKSKEFRTYIDFTGPFRTNGLQQNGAAHQTTSIPVIADRKDQKQESTTGNGSKFQS